MENQKLLRWLVIFVMIFVFALTTTYFALQIKSNLDYISLLRKNPFGGHPQAIKTNIRAEWRKIGGKTLQYLLVNGIILGIGFFALLNIRPSKAQKKDSSPPK